MSTVLIEAVSSVTSIKSSSTENSKWQPNRFLKI
jgi:hypothetical protein